MVFGVIVFYLKKCIFILLLIKWIIYYQMD